ncbi:hypothetical protein NDU88_005884 [Pleurodeles waltl]|uniref:Uncharacterized protein n=1 Tax=Pleurodeles waltl TaxID=8319 RepID=A0AAV7QMA9_PLEWA|nr:hypothetical protein NDU88_005884 [Pleurodeles waltl]
MATLRSEVKYGEARKPRLRQFRAYSLEMSRNTERGLSPLASAKTVSKEEAVLTATLQQVIRISSEGGSE